MDIVNQIAKKGLIIVLILLKLGGLFVLFPSVSCFSYHNIQQLTFIMGNFKEELLMVCHIYIF